MSNLYNFFTKIRTGFSNALSLFCAVLISGLFCTPTVFAQPFSGTYNFASVTTTSGTSDPTSPPTATGVTFGNFSAVGLSANSNASGRFSFTGNPTGATNASDVFTGSFPTSQYFQVTVTVTGTSVDLTGITFTIQRSGTGIRQFSVRSSADAYAANLPASESVASLSVVSTNIFQITDATTSATIGSTITLSGPNFTNLPNGTTRTFRFYGWNSEATTGTFSIDDVVISGTSATASPSISVSVATLPKFFANSTLPSEGNSFTVTGSNLGSNNLTVGPLSGYEFSTTSNFVSPQSSLSFIPSSGSVATTTVFTRLNNTNVVGNYNGNITVDASGSGATPQNISVTGQVYSNGSPFTTGNIVTLRVGEVGGTTLTTASAPVFIDEYTTTGTFVQSVPLPFVNNGAQRKFTMSGTSTTEGFLNLSPDGQYLSFGGYDAIPGVSGISSTTASSTNRIVARVTQNGNINTTTRISDGYDGNSIRSAATVDGTSFWTGGAGNTSTGGTRYVNLGASTSVQVSTTITNTRGTAIYNSQLYSSAASVNLGISTVGTGLPTSFSASNLHTILSGTTSNLELVDPRGFVFADVDDNGTPDVLYVADASATASQGVVKFSNTGGVWTKRGNLPNPSGRTVHGIGVQVVGGNRVLYICLGTTTTPANEIYKFTDNSAVTANITSSGTDIILASGSPIITSPAATQVLYKGVSFAPVNVPTPTINHTFTTPVSTVSQGSSEPIYSVQLDITDGNALLTGFTTQTGGVYLGSDFTSFKLVLSTNSTYEVTDPVLSTISTSTGPGQTLAFTGLGQNLPVGTTRYLFVVASASGCASVGNSIQINSTPLSNITYSNPLSVKNGTPTAGSSVSTVIGVLDNVNSFTAVGGQPTVQLSWTNPACFTEIVIVAHTAPINGIPSGTYTGNTNYLGTSSSFPGGGKVVYVGSTSPQTITGLTLNQLYYFKAFVKFNTNYSPGVQVTATPTLVNIYSRGSGLSHSDAIWSLSPNGTPQTLSAVGGMTTIRGLVIQTGHTVDLSQSGGAVVCRELIVENGATFKTNLTTNTYLTVFGDVTNNGTIGTGGTTVNTISLNAEGAAVNFKGNGVTDFNIIRKNTSTNQTTTLNIQSDVNIRATGTGLFTNTANIRLNTVISAGKTLNVIGDVALDGFNGTDATERAGTIINNGKLYVGGTLFLRNNNTTAAYACGYSTAAGSYTQVSNLLCDLTTGQGTNVNLSSSSKLDVLGALTVTSGSLSSNGAITLKSSASSTARVATSAGVISGNITSERYVANGGWHFTGTVFPSQTITDWRDDIWTQGPMPGVQTYNPGYNTSMIFGYDQDNDDPIPYVGGTTKGWIVPTTSSIEQYKGYRVYINSGSSLDNTGNYTMEPGPISLNYNPTSLYPGWNLITNPHLSAVNTSGFTWGAGVQQVVIIWNPITNQYQYFGTLGGLTGVTLNSSITPIASGQAFFVKCTSASTLTIPQTAKSASSGTFFRTATENPQNALEIRIKNEDSEFDATLLQFVEGSDMEYETSLDATKLMNPNLNVYTLVNDEKLAINAMPNLEETMIVPLGYRVSSNGICGFQIDGVSLINGYDKLYLKDNFNNTIQEVTSSGTIIFNTEAGEFNSRFELLFTNSISSIEKLQNITSVKVYPNPVVSDKFNITFDETSNTNVIVSDVLGRVITNGFYNSNKISIDKPSQSGQYFIKIQTPKTTITKTLYVK